MLEENKNCRLRGSSLPIPLSTQTFQCLFNLPHPCNRIDTHYSNCPSTISARHLLIPMSRFFGLFADTVDSPHSEHRYPPDPGKPTTLWTCSVSEKEFGCMTPRPSPQKSANVRIYSGFAATRSEDCRLYYRSSHRPKGSRTL
jgi:hypothetical protein